MAVFSVYDYDRKQFDYYQTDSDVTHQSLGSVKFGTMRQPRPVAGKKPFGNVSEAIAYKLPMGAKKIGSGDIPKGVIASKLGATVDVFGVNVSLGKLAIGGLLLGGIVFALSKRNEK